MLRTAARWSLAKEACGGRLTLGLTWLPPMSDGGQTIAAGLRRPRGHVQSVASMSQPCKAPSGLCFSSATYVLDDSALELRVRWF